MQKYITYVECIWNCCKRTSGSWSLSLRWNICFGKIVFEIFRICRSNITQLQKNKKDKHFDIYKFIFFKCRIHLSDNSRIIFRKTKKCPLNIRFFYKFLYKVQNVSPNITLLQKTKENVTNSKSNVFLIASNQ